MKTIEELLEGYQPQFVESYKDCHNIEEIEGQTVEGEWSGYAFRAFGSDIRYFTDEGIRGFEQGKYRIENGIPFKVREDYRQVTLLREDWEVLYNALNDENDPKLKEIKGYLKRAVRY